jgi:hypothetical protein
MAVPVFVGAGTGAAILTGTATVSKTGCTSGNLILMHIAIGGQTEDWSTGTFVGLDTLAGSPGFSDGVLQGPYGTRYHGFQMGRATASTVSLDLTVGASGEDLFARLYEFSGEFEGTTLGSVIENSIGAGSPVWGHSNATSTSVADEGVGTNGNDRLALQLVALATNQAIGDFTGETGGDWTEAAEYQDATGVTSTMQLQTASIPSSGTIDGGSATVSSVAWGVWGIAIIPAAVSSAPTLRVMRSNLRW